MDYKQHKGILRGQIKNQAERKLYNKRIRMEEIDVDTSERQLTTHDVSSRLSDVPDNTYVWFFGERWKKVRTGKKTTKVIKVDNLSNNFCVAMELP